jgi:hypothetical protein
MPQAFIIMPIGNPELDKVAASAMVPALVACGLDPKRVDKHNAGGLLKTEIIGFIETAEIIVADLTLERPNCYLEIGYAMGIDKFKNLILTVREDHFPESKNHRKGGPKVHFDLAGYEILRWDPDDIDAFRNELEKRIRRRLAVTAPLPTAPTTTIQNNWLTQQIAVAEEGMKATSRTAFMELHFVLVGAERFPLPKLREAANHAQIHTFGWPIGVFLQTDGIRPHPRADGIAAEIPREGRDAYDYWALRRNGEFYWRGTLFEDDRSEGQIFFDTRIVRVTEALLYCARLYATLGMDRLRIVTITVRHVGLRDRRLSSANPNRNLHDNRDPAHENESVVQLTVRLEQLESELVSLVKEVLAPLFALFDFFELNDRVYEDIVNRFVAGQV